jgi:hypothetical protein
MRTLTTSVILGTAAVLLGLAPARAAAQPTCVAATVADYLALGPGGGCRVGGVTFAGFAAIVQGVNAAAPAPGEVLLTPLAVPRGGRSYVGFRLSAAPAFAVTSPGVETDCSGTRCAALSQLGLTFDARGALTSYAVADLDGAARASGDFYAFAEAILEPSPPRPLVDDDAVLNVSVLRDSPPVPGCGPVAGGGCPMFAEFVGRSPTDRYRLITAAYADFQPAEPKLGVEGSSDATFGGVTFLFGVTPTVVPEPSTVALLAAGLLAVAGVAARRARTAP